MIEKLERFSWWYERHDVQRRTPRWMGMVLAVMSAILLVGFLDVHDVVLLFGAVWIGVLAVILISGTRRRWDD